MERSSFTIDVGAVRRNAETLQRAAGAAELWAVVKAEGYGHGAVDVSRAAIEGGASALFPDRWEDYVAPIPRRERGHLVKAFYKRLTSRSRNTQLAAARAWSIWEAATSFLHTDAAQVAHWGEDQFAIQVARIECHYFVNKGFLRREDQLLRDVRRIRHIPSVIVQGRYDVVCPMQTAWELHRAWPEAEFNVIAAAGHSALEPGNTDALVRATDRFARA